MHILYLLIEFLDELVFGVGEAAWPLIRNDLGLNYAQIGLALSLPGFLANFIEPFLFTISDVWKRRAVILLGGIFFTVALLLTGISSTFLLLLFSFILFHPSSGAFVGISQASLMDLDPARRESNMARWTFAGSLGVVAGPILLAGAAWIGFGWRGMFIGLALLSTLILLLAWTRIPDDKPHPVSFPRFGKILKQFGIAFSALKNWSVVRWLILLEFSDLMLDIFYGFLPLYFVDVAGFTPAQAALSVAIWSGVGLLGDFLLIPLVERVSGLDYLRISVVLELLLFPLFLLSPQPWLKLVLVGSMGFFNAGWYAILKANLFDSMHCKSGLALTLDNVSGLIGKLIPFGIGLAAQAFGLGAAMWLLLAGPIALLIGLPRKTNQSLISNY
ncbi:MAG TPA: MFS transporter [Anaerolineales bacterium]|nr:MFS transporter [Anaerolineales bacterium]